MTGSNRQAKQFLGAFAAARVSAGMRIGIGSGTTVEAFIDALGRRTREYGFAVTCVAASDESAHQAESEGFTVVPLADMSELDLAVDGADAVNPDNVLIKGGGAALVRERHRLRAEQEDDFIIRSPDDLAQAQAESGRVMALLLASIASVSLLVGGIGIMNTMLVSVTERTREIGVRMAVGATEADVQNQFLAEALVLSFMGGGAGVVAGIVGSRAVSNMLHWPTQIPIEAILIAVVFSAGVGIFFGYYPARKAAHLDPIEALRYE